MVADDTTEAWRYGYSSYDFFDTYLTAVFVLYAYFTNIDDLLV